MTHSEAKCHEMEVAASFWALLLSVGRELDVIQTQAVASRFLGRSGRLDQVQDAYEQDHGMAARLAVIE